MSKKHKRNIFGKNYKLLEMKRLFLYDYRYEVACMKWIIAILIGLLAFTPAVAEEASGTVYVLEYSQEGMENWAARESLEEEDVLLSLYCETSPGCSGASCIFGFGERYKRIFGWLGDRSVGRVTHPRCEGNPGMALTVGGPWFTAGVWLRIYKRHLHQFALSQKSIYCALWRGYISGICAYGWQ